MECFIDDHHLCTRESDMYDVTSFGFSSIECQAIGCILQMGNEVENRILRQPRGWDVRMMGQPSNGSMKPGQAFFRNEN